MKKFLGSIALALLTGAAIAAPPEVDTAEILRRGDFVERVGSGIAQSIGQDQISEALSPPADDSHKWFVTLLTQKNCPACERLKADFARAPELKAFVAVDDYKRSWAHYNVYRVPDPTQDWRWKGLKIKGFPTLLIQPPFSRKFGDPATVVMQKTGYDGRPEKLAREISNGIKLYVKKVAEREAAHKQREARPATSEIAVQKPMAGHGQVAPLGADPPFTPAPKVEPSPDLLPLDIPGPLDPDRTPTPAIPPPVPETPSALPTAPTVYVVYGDTPATIAEDKRIVRVVKNLRQRAHNLTEKVLDFNDAKKLFPSLDKDKLPAVVVVDEGKVDTQVDARTLPLIVPEEVPWQSFLAIVTAIFTGAGLPWAAVGGVTVWLLGLWKKKREADGKPRILPKPVFDDLSARLKNLEELVRSLMKPTP